MAAVAPRLFKILFVGYNDAVCVRFARDLEIPCLRVN